MSRKIPSYRKHKQSGQGTPKKAKALLLILKKSHPDLFEEMKPRNFANMLSKIAICEK